MSDIRIRIRKYGLDTIFIGLPALGAFACWIYGLPLWMLVICLVALLFSVVSLLGDLGLFGRQSDD